MNIIIGSDWMKLIVGLGNPGREYQKTRHNIGFNLVDYYLKEKNYNEKWSKKFDGEFVQISICGEKVFFLKPLTYMNLSGNSVRKIMEYYQIEVDDLLVIADDLDLNVGNFKLKDKGSCGGHNGLRSIEQNLGTNQYKRLKVGISKNNDIDTKDYVLGEFSSEERNKINDLFQDLVIVLDDYFSLPFGDLMNKYNRKNR